MKRALTFLFAVVSCWTVSFVQAANVGLNFYSGVPGESASVAEDLHYALTSVDGNDLAQGTMVAENEGKAGVDVDANSFYVIVEQPSTKFFGSVLVEKVAADSDLFFILDETGLTWLKDAHSCPDDAKCKQDGGVCDCGDDCCDENCICRELKDYLSKDSQGDSNIAEKTSTRGQNSQNSYRTSTSANTVPRTPYSYGASNFGNYGFGASAYGANGSMGSTLGMLGMIGAVIAIAVSKSPSGTSAEK